MPKGTSAEDVKKRGKASCQRLLFISKNDYLTRLRALFFDELTQMHDIKRAPIRFLDIRSSNIGYHNSCKIDISLVYGGYSPSFASFFT
jgi:hypothetical protein